MSELNVKTGVFALFPVLIIIKQKTVPEEKLTAPFAVKNFPRKQAVHRNIVLIPVM